MSHVLKASAPLAMALAAVIAAQVWLSPADSPGGHAAEHAASATIPFAMAFVVAMIVWALPGTERRGPALWALLALVAVAAALNVQGNLMVVDAIGDERWSLEDVDTLGPTRDGFEDGHDRAELGGLAGVAAAGALLVWLGVRRTISPRLCASTVAVSLLFPYWMFPGFGLVIVAGVLATRRFRREVRSATTARGVDVDRRGGEVHLH